MMHGYVAMVGVPSQVQQMTNLETCVMTATYGMSDLHDVHSCVFILPGYSFYTEKFTAAISYDCTPAQPRLP